MLYAKSNPRETIWEHTNRLLEALEAFKCYYGSKLNVDDEFWSMLRLAVKVHDFGKANLLFQNKLRQILGEPKLPCPLPEHDEIPHNYLSVAFLPYTQLQLSTEDWQLLVWAVGYHHERPDKPDRKQIQQFMQAAFPEQTIDELYTHMQWDFAPEKPSNALLKTLQKRDEMSDSIKHNPTLFRRYVLLKGLLHRLDHSASAHVDVETGVSEYAGDKVRQFMAGKYELRPAQSFAAEHKDQNVVMVASTGSGKTEASLLWADRDKTFITLPLRVSLNAMFDRLHNSDNVGLKSLGLLHSGSFDYLLEQDALDAEESYRISRQLSQKVTLCTIDQILKFPFLYRGFEKELATMSYSKLVIDEIQAYDPNIAAMLIKALEMTVAMGSRFMVMTATMPQLYLDELNRRMSNLGASLAYGEFPNDELLRHRIALRAESILDAVEEIYRAGQKHKVLVICNTVERAIEVYELLRKLGEPYEEQSSIRLLHARFIQKHRMALERLITGFARSGWHERETEHLPGIWVTTQVVEASVDVDFDMLYTEACTLDSLFQRMGRCYRVRSYDQLEPNVFLLTKDVSGLGSVYDRLITDRSLKALEPFNGQRLKESEKMELVKQLYNRDNLQGLDFLKKFEAALDLFDNMRMFELSSQESQKLLREIRSKEIIPPVFWEQACQLADQYASSHDVQNRRRIRRELQQMTVSLNERSLEFRKIAYRPMQTRGLEYLHWISHADVEYDFNEETMLGTGLKYRKGVNLY